MSGFTAFEGTRRIAAGTLLDVALAAQASLAADPASRPLIFADADARPVDLDLRGDAGDLRRRLEEPDPEPDAPARGRGRPKLGVVAREVTLLPRHWDWLAGQPGGASVALRKLVEEARRASQEPDRRRFAREAAYRFMSAMAGDQPGYEEACRALFAGDAARLETETRGWPADVRDHALRLAAAG